MLPTFAEVDELSGGPGPDGPHAEGRSDTAIGRRLRVLEGTAEKDVRSILAELRLREASGDHHRFLAILAFLS